MSIEERVKKIVSDQLGKDVEEIQSDSSFVDDLGADSLDTVELVMALEEEFDLEEYLKRTKGQGLEIKKVANSS